MVVVFRFLFPRKAVPAKIFAPDYKSAGRPWGGSFCFCAELCPLFAGCAADWFAEAALVAVAGFAPAGAAVVGDFAGAAALTGLARCCCAKTSPEKASIVPANIAIICAKRHLVVLP